MALYVKDDLSIETSNPAEGVQLLRSGFTKTDKKKAAPEPEAKEADRPANKARAARTKSNK